MHTNIHTRSTLTTSTHSHFINIHVYYIKTYLIHTQPFYTNACARTYTHTLSYKQALTRLDTFIYTLIGLHTHKLMRIMYKLINAPMHLVFYAVITVISLFR